MRNKEKDKAWREANKERLTLYMKQWKEDNKDHLNQYRLDNKEKLNETSRNWQKDNKQKAYRNHVNYVRNRLKKEPFFKFKKVVRSLIKKSFYRADIGITKKSKSEDILGCTLEFFRDYILSQCPEDVTLEDFHTHGYHIDHKIPISSAKTEEEVLKLCHYTNLQPLWCSDNIKKSNKLQS